MVVNSPLIARLPASLVWPLIPLVANRALEMMGLLLGFITPLVGASFLIALKHPSWRGCSMAFVEIVSLIEVERVEASTRGPCL